MMFGKKKKIVKKSYDPAAQTPILHCSICNGEQVAGFNKMSEADCVAKLM